MARLQYGVKYPRKVKPLSRVHTARTSQTDRQTDRQTETDGFAMPLVKRNVVTFG